MSVTMTSTKIGNLDLPKLSSNILFTSNNSSELNTPTLIPLTGLNCGIPTRTTPTMTPVTPTTLCQNLEQALLNFEAESESHQNEAGFVPPLLQTSSNESALLSLALACQESTMLPILSPNSNTSTSTGSWSKNNSAASLPSVLPGSSSSTPIPTHILAMSNENSCSSSSSSTSGSVKKYSGGRRPNKDIGLSAEEEEKRKIRRERNKEAAARCRKRRLDRTNLLIDETEELEAEKRKLEDELETVKLQAETLKAILKDHELVCNDLKERQLGSINVRCCDVREGVIYDLRDAESPDDIKPLIIDMDEDTDLMNLDNGMKHAGADFSPSLVSSSPASKRKRPNFLPLPVTSFAEKKHSSIPIVTPSTGILDSLMPCGTGLTPITSAILSSCSNQLRNGGESVELCSSDPTS